MIMKWSNFTLCLWVPLPVPDDFMLCLQDEPEALKYFESLPESSKKECLNWIYAINSEEIIVDRMASAINKLAFGMPVC